MPYYSYRCDKCNYIFDEFRDWIVRDEKFMVEGGDSSISMCPQCQNIANRIIANIGGIIFKGSGFYKNDYKKKGE